MPLEGRGEAGRWDMDTEMMRVNEKRKDERRAERERAMAEGWLVGERQDRIHEREREIRAEGRWGRRREGRSK